MEDEFERVGKKKKKTMSERWCGWEILISREVDRARQISGAISQTLSKSNNEQFISNHWSSTMAAYQGHSIPALSLVSQTGSIRSPGPQLVPRQGRPGQARPGPARSSLLALAGHQLMKTFHVNSGPVCELSCLALVRSRWGQRPSQPASVIKTFIF